MSIDRYAAFLPQARQGAVFARPVTESYLALGGFNVHTLTRSNLHAPSRIVLAYTLMPCGPLAAQIPADLAELCALDVPLYGATQAHQPRAVRYEDWIRVLLEYLKATEDGRPVYLFGLSIGGLLALEVAHLHGGVCAFCHQPPWLRLLPLALLATWAASWTVLSNAPDATPY